ncbi:DUF4327 domain-containing protein [Fischerella thermalis CCMEE 5205]|uniref:DUF4327 domain-containing protein n=1 Tax=Fischerella thermalis CCMEE 5318 TaxID=2019666 RepID=A0A2N6L7P7_9CYAN|nr:DUF4327 family protein [Fischerella thermalis]PMB18116.1 DUF4327 domain-containing protein [Fischerella thermalis CCMEE 5318]PMB46257.1 DUF4327 domain-containing protein [Fischerella thermalis CCMEE 5205]
MADTAVKYNIEYIREKAVQLVNQGLIQRNQPIYVLCKYLPYRDWLFVELELERNEFLLRDCIIDLLSREKWSEG